jgi:hypothetical protein
VWHTPWGCVRRCVSSGWELEEVLDLPMRPSRPATLRHQASSRSLPPSSTHHWPGCHGRQLLLRCTTCCSCDGLYREGQANSGSERFLISKCPRPAVVVKKKPTALPRVELWLATQSNEGPALSRSGRKGSYFRLHASNNDSISPLWTIISAWGISSSSSTVHAETFAFGHCHDCPAYFEPNGLHVWSLALT